MKPTNQIDVKHVEFFLTLDNFQHDKKHILTKSTLQFERKNLICTVSKVFRRCQNVEYFTLKIDVRNVLDLKTFLGHLFSLKAGLYKWWFGHYFEIKSMKPSTFSTTTSPVLVLFYV